MISFLLLLYNLVYLKNCTLLTVSSNAILYLPSTIAANQQEYIPLDQHDTVQSP